MMLLVAVLATGHLRHDLVPIETTHFNHSRSDNAGVFRAVLRVTPVALLAPSPRFFAIGMIMDRVFHAHLHDAAGISNRSWRLAAFGRKSLPRLLLCLDLHHQACSFFLLLHQLFEPPINPRLSPVH
ncbi:hypothetical protein D3C71_1701000 [compost metagenome]